MRDLHRLRSRIAILAGLATIPATGCNPPPKPEKADPAAERDGRRGGDRNAQRGTRAERAAALEADKRPLSPTREKYYRKKAEEQGVPLSEVVPDHFELPADANKARVRSRPEKFKTVADAKIAAAKRRGTDDEGKAEAKRPAVQAANRAPAASALAGFPGDPPFIDGYNPEEATCPSGNWCGDKTSAGAVQILEATDDSLGCPIKIGGSRGRDTKPIEGPEYEGLSDKPNMQGNFNAHGTELARAAESNDDICCYHWFEYCSGRPHMDASGPVVAGVVEGDAAVGAWQRGPGATDDVSGPLRARLAAAWRRDALAEHASIASFARATLELLSVGAPADLVARAQQAGLDEVDHAQRCFALASRYGGATVAPGPLPALSPRTADLARLAADTFAEGCVAETIAALVAERSANRCEGEALRSCLTAIAGDETRHAALAWATVRWAISQGGDAVVRAVADKAASIRPPADPLPEPDADAEALARHGRLDARAHTLAARDAWSGIIDPLLAQLT